MLTDLSSRLTSLGSLVHLKTGTFAQVTQVTVQFERCVFQTSG